MNPFEYFKTPSNKKEAQSNINHWWYVMMGGVPEGEIEANWNVYIRSMTDQAKRDLKKMEA